MSRSLQRESLFSEAKERKQKADEEIAERRFNSLKNKMMQMKRSHIKSTDFGSKSRISFMKK